VAAPQAPPIVAGPPQPAASRVDAPPASDQQPPVPAADEIQRVPGSVINADRRPDTSSAAPSAAPPRGPVRVGGVIEPPRKIKDQPVAYPLLAQRAHVQGKVVLDATITADGRVQDVRVVRSIPLLDKAAIAAVKQWQYTPTLLNGAPVPVIMTVSVDFSEARK
jgi:protein TonB